MQRPSCFFVCSAGHILSESVSEPYPSVGHGLRLACPQRRRCHTRRGGGLRRRDGPQAVPVPLAGAASPQLPLVATVPFESAARDGPTRPSTRCKQ